MIDALQVCSHAFSEAGLSDVARLFDVAREEITKLSDMCLTLEKQARRYRFLRDRNMIKGIIYGDDVDCMIDREIMEELMRDFRNIQ